MIKDIDDLMPADEVDSYVESMVFMYEDLIRKRIEAMIKNGSLLTYRKMKRLKKNVLFILLKEATK